MPGLDDPLATRHADAELLSLALIDTRNVCLRWLALLEDQRLLGADAAQPGGPEALWRIGQAAWYQEWLIARNVQRARGDAVQTVGPRLASIHPQADGWFGPDTPGHREVPSAELLRDYLAETLEITLDLLGTAAGDDEGLYVYRAALLHEDRVALALAELALDAQWPVQLPPLPARVDREPIWLPAQTVQVGAARGGFVPENERWAHAVAVPEFEIDAQAVDWARYVPFAEDGGYDERRWWSDEGWAWLQASGLRAPMHVEQLRGGVVLMRQGRLARAPATQPVVHASRHEAEAWCRWAGRRLPTEPEWALAVRAAASRGFVWGDVFEWVAGSARAYPGHAPTPDGLDRIPAPGSAGVLRGASWLCRGRLKHPQARRFAPPASSRVAAGFRSCSL